MECLAVLFCPGFVDIYRFEGLVADFLKWEIFVEEKDILLAQNLFCLDYSIDALNV